jgi:gas vesicle protein
MSDNRTDALTAFLLGAVVGAGVALLLAPQTGEETRKKLGDTARGLREGLDDKLKTVRDDLDDKLKTVRDEVKSRASDVKTAVGAGRDAYARARTGDDSSAV